MSGTDLIILRSVLKIFEYPLVSVVVLLDDKSEKHSYTIVKIVKMI